MTDLLDVAIVGGGVGGLYCAWRLLETERARRVAVFEGSGRLGGRLLSAAPPGIPRLHAELGGTRFLKGAQTRVSALVDRLGLETYPFPVSEPDNLAYLRGVRLRESDFTDRAWEVPYRLGYLEKSKGPGELVLAAIEQVIPGIIGMSDARRREVVKTTSFAGRPLHDQGLWQVLGRVMSHEARALAVAAGGYSTALANWNAADAIPWFLADSGIDAGYHGFVKGFGEVPRRLAEEVEQAGGELTLHARLQAVERDGEALVLRFADDREVKARAAVLAMPRRSLELLSPTGPVLGDARVRRLVASVTPRPLLRLFVAYHAPWWLAAGVERGRSVTDLPLRQAYYWPNPDGTARLSGNALLMASYDDSACAGFWDGLRRPPGARWGIDDPDEPPEPFEGAPMPKGDDSAPWDAHRAPRAMIEEIQRQLGQLHALPHVPEPYAAAFMDWGEDPYGGGWNTWNIGVKSWEIETEILQPAAGIPVYICGEAYSRQQGWVEGALDTADQVLARFFGVPALST